MFKPYRRTIAAASIAVAMVFGGAAAASAVPNPDSGPVTGGTLVSVDEPRVTFTQISTGRDHSVGIASDGNTYSWGSNDNGQLGIGTSGPAKLTPVRVNAPAGVTFTRVSAGFRSSMALGSDGKLYAWGYNGSGALGDGTTTDRFAPVPVQTPAGVSITEFSMRSNASMAVGSDGKTYSWGANLNGQLGDGTFNNRPTPGLVTTPAGVTFTRLSAGDGHMLAIGSDQKLYAWGSNVNGELGDGTATLRTLPVAVHTPAGVTFSQVSAGYAQSHAIGSDGNTYGWGSNLFGQLGDGTTTNRSTPVTVQLPTGVTFTSVVSSDYDSAAIGSDGHTYTWGQNSNGQLGTGTTTPRTVPGQVQEPAGVTFTQIDGNGSRYLAVGSDGNGYGWGSNSGALGNGGLTNSPLPVMVLMDVQITGVTFDGLDGTGLVDNGDGTWSATTPPHAAGPVDVVVSWTLNGVAQTPVTYGDGFTYEPLAVAPTITDPSDQTVADGATATFEVSTTGTPNPTVVWQVSRDNGATWESITADPDATVSSDGLKVTVKGSPTNDGYLYRATATNSAGSATSAGAKLTVTKTPPIQVAPKITNPKDQVVKNGTSAKFTVQATGTPTPTVKWQVSRDGGQTWEAVSADPTAKLSNGGLTLTVTGSKANNGYLYRATASNSVGSATSDVAKLTVTQKDENGGGTPKPTTPRETKVDSSLAITGAGSEQGLLFLSLSALILGGGLVVTNRVLKRRQKH